MVYPGAPEVCHDGLDNDCDGAIDESTDEDGDGYSTCDGDCDDADAAIHPGATEVCNDRDDDCSGGGGDYYVTTTGSADFATIQSALDNVPPGCSIVVAPGTYWEALEFPGTAIYLRSQDGPETTTISAGGVGSVLTFYNGDTRQTIVEGFTITGGTGTDLWTVAEGKPPKLEAYGGGAIIRFGSSPTLINLWFTDNSAIYGGAIYADDGTFVVDGCTFQNNDADYGGAVLVYNTTPTIQNSTFEGNQAQYAAALYSVSGFVEVDECTFEGNRATQLGGAVAEAESTITVSDCVFQDNYAPDGGAFWASHGTFTLSDCSFVGNTAEIYGSAVSTLGCVDSTISRNLFQDNDFTGTDAGQGTLDLQQMDGLIIRDNTFLGNATTTGGGLSLADNTDTTVADNLFQSNTAETLGGAMVLFGSGEAAVEGNTFVDNTAQTGGGAVECSTLEQVALELSSNIFQANASEADGGAILIKGACTATLTHNVLVDNMAADSGGALRLDNAIAIANNNILAQNEARYGGGLAAAGTSAASAVFANNTFDGNAGRAAGGAVYLEMVTPAMVNNLLTNSTAGYELYFEGDTGATPDTIRYNDLYASSGLVTNLEGVAGSNGNLSVDPVYVDPADMDFTLASGSPVIDAGDPDTVYNDADGTRNDMGAFGGPGGNWSFPWPPPSVTARNVP